MTQHNFSGTIAVGKAILNDSRGISAEPLESNGRGLYEIGQCKSVRIQCVSEQGWHSRRDRILETGAQQNEFQNERHALDWDRIDFAGNCALIDMETLEGAHCSFLFDCGSDAINLDKCFIREGIDKLLIDGKILCLVISHEHRDHFTGLEAVLSYNPKIRIYIPSTFDPRSLYCLAENTLLERLGLEWIEHQGVLVKLTQGEVVGICSGCAAITFKCASSAQVRSETSLCFNIKDKGIVFVSGCCHQNILNFAAFAKEKIEGGRKMYGFYGGLHIAPLEQINPAGEATIVGMAEYGLEKIACNHCTGVLAVRRMIEMGYPIVKGTARFGSESKLYVGNGDEVFFG